MASSTSRYVGDMAALSVALRERDTYTAGHNDRTSTLAVGLGKDCRLDKRQLRVLEGAAILHDIGKIAIPDRVLMKQGKLDPQEWEVMKTHSECGFRILAAVESEYMQEVAGAVRHHHEAWDGNGYLGGLRGEAIPLLARIIGLADSYDAMATTRAYHRARPHRTIMDILHGEDVGKYDPWLLARFTAIIEKSPLKSRVE